ncbi:MAG: hypothetical protein M1347_01615 [Chloroflexi bacterium]|nr:hypothetical protein [Chloroflexota bacterium]
MPKEKWKRREKKIEKRKRGMRVSGRSVFTLQEIQKKKAEQAKKSKSAKAKKKA